MRKLRIVEDGWGIKLLQAEDLEIIRDGVGDGFTLKIAGRIFHLGYLMIEDKRALNPDLAEILANSDKIDWSLNR